ncbi:MAG: hypothetical protein ACLQAR_01540 [Steroidobacteraceae bacterium]
MGKLDSEQLALLQRVEKAQLDLRRALCGGRFPRIRLTDDPDYDPREIALNDFASTQIDALVREATGERDYREVVCHEWWRWPRKGLLWRKFIAAADSEQLAWVTA